MADISRTIQVGQKPTEEERKRMRAEIKQAQKMGDVYDSECPPSAPNALAEFAVMAREIRRNRRNSARVVSIRLSPETLEKYKTLGKGYTSIMADILKYAADNPEVFIKAAVQ